MLLYNPKQYVFGSTSPGILFKYFILTLAFISYTPLISGTLNLPLGLLLLISTILKISLPLLATFEPISLKSNGMYL